MTSREVVFREARSRAAAALLGYLDCRCERHAKDLTAAAQDLLVAARRAGYPSQRERARELAERVVA